MNVNDLDNLFKEYGYEIKEQSSSYRVYLSNQGMYHGAEIQILDDDKDASSILNRYSKLGYHAKEQRFKSIEEAENYLFEGFFNTKTTSFEIKKRYEEFTNTQMKHYGNKDLKYQYINMPYSIIRDEETKPLNSDHSLIENIKTELEKKGAHLIIIEAAAGFGKTCTAYEVFKTFIDNYQSQKPIFTELSRNREVKQFKYILWAEIDKEKDTTAKQELVVYNIKKGKIPLIIDGFDELLTKNIDHGKDGQLNDFEQVETMLSTIGDLLTDNAKVILTSRKTAIFAGSEFANWVDSYDGKFDVIRIQLEKPEIKHWLSNERYEEIINKNVPIESISNPVLLTYLRNIDSDRFKQLLSYPEKITGKYFEYLLNREKERQEIIIRWEDQMTIFQNLARSFVEFDIKGENRNFIKELIVEYNKPKLLYYKDLMSQKQTLEELADTLTNHALLDRIGNKDYITFINEFVFGYLLGKSIQNDSSGYLQRLEPIPEYLVELAVFSFRYTSNKDKSELWNKLKILKNRISSQLSILIDCTLKKKITGNYCYEVISSETFEKIEFLNEFCKFSSSSFTDSIFNECTFDIKSFENATFTGCTFTNCKITDESLNSSISVYCYGCEDYNSGFISSIMDCKLEDECHEQDTDLEIQILGKYFKVDGKTPKMRYITAIKKEFEEHNLNVIFTTFNLIKKKGFIITNGNNSFITKEGINYYQKIYRHEHRI